MRICLYVGKAPPRPQQREWLANAKSTCDVYAANLFREFRRRGHEVIFASAFSARPRGEIAPELAQKRLARFAKLEYPQADHAICLEQHGFLRRERVFFESVRAATRGLVCSICDKDYEAGPEDLLFTARRPLFHPDKARYVGWAANSGTFHPDKDPNWLTIFVDHKSNADGRYDDTEALLKSATTYAASLAHSGRRVGNPPRPVRVIFFSPDGLEIIPQGEIRDVDLGDDPRRFYRRVPGPELADWLRKTDVFVVTHGESMGLPVLESAMSGALVVAGRGYIKPELLRSLAHYEYDRVEDIAWDGVFERLDPEMSRRRALHFTWAEVARRILEPLEASSSSWPSTPTEYGDWLIKEPVPITDREFGSLSTWDHKYVTLIDDCDGQKIRPVGGRNTHYVRRTVRKNPWPEAFTLTFMMKPEGTNVLRAWFCGENTNERTELHFDLAKLTVRERKPRNGWALVDSLMTRSDAGVLCQLVVLSDWAPLMRCMLLLAAGDDLRFDDRDSPSGVWLSRVELARGIPFATRISRPERGKMRDDGDNV